MKKSVSEARAECVRYYEDKTYSHDHAEGHISHDADQIMRVYHAIQEEKKLPPKTERNNPCFWIDSEAGGSLCPEASGTGQIWAKSIKRSVRTFI